MLYISDANDITIDTVVNHKEVLLPISEFLALALFVSCPIKVLRNYRHLRPQHSKRGSPQALHRL